MNRYLAPFRRSFGLELRSCLPWRRTNDFPILPPEPPAYDEFSGYPRSSTPVFPDLPPPDYEIVIQFPAFESPPPTYAEAMIGMIENTEEVNGHNQTIPEETARISNPENQNGASTEFVSIDMPGYSNVSFSRNEISGSTNAGPQLNGGITNTVVAGNLFNIESRNYFTSMYSIPFINSKEAVEFMKRIFFTFLMACVMIYFRIFHPDWMPQWAFVLVICLLILGLTRHLPNLLREYRESRY